MMNLPYVLRLTLPGVVSWSRPRRARGGVRYPAAYARDRDAWAAVVAHAVAGQRWSAPATARYRVTVAVYGGGKRDLDRVCTAVLDALQNGGAVHDDCLVDALAATRSRAPRSDGPRTVVEVKARTRGDAPRPRSRRRPAGTTGARQEEERRAR